MRQQNEEMKQQNELMLEKMEMLDEVPEVFGMLCEEANKSRMKRLDCYGSSKRSNSEQKEFREEIIEYYGLSGQYIIYFLHTSCVSSSCLLLIALVCMMLVDSKQPDQLYCMVSGEWLPSDELRAAHIWKSATAGEGRYQYNDPPTCVFVNIHSHIFVCCCP